MKTIRRGTFETNSSSTHSLTICTKTDYDKWVGGEMFFDDYNDAIISREEAEVFFKADKNDYETFESWLEDSYRIKTYEKKCEEDEEDYELEHYSTNFKTPGGEEVVVFGKYGYQG